VIDHMQGVNQSDERAGKTTIYNGLHVLGFYLLRASSIGTFGVSKHHISMVNMFLKGLSQPHTSLSHPGERKAVNCIWSFSYHVIAALFWRCRYDQTGLRHQLELATRTGDCAHCWHNGLNSCHLPPFDCRSVCLPASRA
jgi:hypothetical protein